MAIKLIKIALMAWRLQYDSQPRRVPAEMEGMTMTNKKLDKLMERLNNMDRDDLRTMDLASLPIFGHKNRQIRHTSEVWSWDDERVMVAGNEGFALEPRCAICGEATFHCAHDQKPTEEAAL